MPILVVGADHPIGFRIVESLVHPEREVRAFVSDPAIGTKIKSLGAKVAIGDLSDEGHLSAAATNCFSIAFVEPAITDGRELSFLSAAEIPASWACAAAEARVVRVIWVGEATPSLSVKEVATVDTSDQSLVAAEVARLDDLQRL